MRRRAAALVLFAVVALIVSGALLLDRLYPPAFGRLAQVSTVVVDRNGVPLRAFTNADGLYRLATTPDDVSPAYLKLLVATEDKRFFAHPGVDPLAVGRALLQRAARGRVVSGASTLTMQVARLLEPRPRTLRSKLIETARALQLEAHWSKRDILAAYLTLAPMGGNIEGVRAGSLAWFGKEPAALSDAEAALLVALPRDPNRVRPDRTGSTAEAARARVLRHAVDDGTVSAPALASALGAPLPETRRPLPVLSPHLAEQLHADAPALPRIATTIDAALQASVERLLDQSLRDMPRPATLAAIVADRHNGEVLARVGNAAYFDARRLGAVDMTRAIRSPGSTLKPFIYGMAFDGLLAHPGSVVHDSATRFDDYAPHNFDGTFNGDVTVRQALQWSLNLPAVVALQRLGPVAFSERWRASGLILDLGPHDTAPGLPIALGGAGTTLESLLAGYAALAEGGVPRVLHDTPREPGSAPPTALMGSAAADAVTDILSGMPAPAGSTSRAGRLAYKTGTSFRFRDGWAVGFDDARVIGVWMGRADGGSCACVGVGAAAILLRLFDLLPPAPLPRRTLTPVFAGPPPPALVRLDASDVAREEDGPRITFPLDRSHLLLDPGHDSIKLAVSGGQRPYRWLVDGRPVESRPFAQEASWHPLTPGFSTVAVVDALGRATQATVRIIGHVPEP